MAEIFKPIRTTVTLPQKAFAHAKAQGDKTGDSLSKYVARLIDADRQSKRRPRASRISGSPGPELDPVELRLTFTSGMREQVERQARRARCSAQDYISRLLMKEYLADLKKKGNNQ